MPGGLFGLIHVEKRFTKPQVRKGVVWIRTKLHLQFVTRFLEIALLPKNVAYCKMPARLVGPSLPGGPVFRPRFVEFAPGFQRSPEQLMSFWSIGCELLQPRGAIGAKFAQESARLILDFGIARMIAKGCFQLPQRCGNLP